MASIRSTPAPTSGTRGQTRLRSGAIQHVDPSLQHNTRRSQRPTPRADTPVDELSNTTDYIRGSGNVLPPVQRWAVVARHPSPIKQESVSSEYSDGSYEVAPQPATRRRRAQSHRMSESNASVYDDNGNEELVNELSKLKGTIWPGMDLFDSATADMKRKRNQKKHESVLRQLQATSEETVALEMIFRDGRLAKERNITGNPESDDDLISGESEPEPDMTEKKPARRQFRVPLADKNPNNGRILRKKERGGSRYQSFGRATKVDPDEEEEMTLTHRPKKNRTGLSIHRDNSGPEITFSQHPASINYLNTGFDTEAHQDLLHRSTPAHLEFAQHIQETFTPRSHSRQPSNDTWGQLNAGFRPVGLGGSNVVFPSTSSFGSYNSYPTGEPQTRSSLSQQYFGQSTIIANNSNPLFEPHVSASDPNAWDHTVFDFNTPDLGMPDMTFHGTGEVSNQLFLGGKSDDEATISAADSDH